MKLVFVGLGGGGTRLCQTLMQYFHYEKNVYDEIWLVDGDSYEERNKSRQFFIHDGNKAISQAKYYRDLYDSLSIMFIDKYITPKNINKIIADGDTVLLGVDNHKTRKLFQDYFEQVENLTVISGANELTDGNVMIMHKVDGELLTRTFSEMHPELENPVDKSPHEMNCEEKAVSHPQIGLVNATIADAQARILYAMTAGRGIDFDEKFVNCLTAMERAVPNEKTTERLVIKNGKPTK